MEYKVFLGKYRVPTTKGARWWEARRGHLGVSYAAEEMGCGRKVALELVPAFLLGETERGELKRAAAAAKQIRHINIPTLYEFGVEGEQFVYVAEYLDGLTAQSWVATHGPAPIATALGIMLQAVSALRVAAQHDIHHPAIHPGNLMILRGQTAEGGWPLIKVLHFLGPRPNSRAFDVANPTLADTTLFASPEQTAGGTVDFQSATYSLGVTLWFLLTAAMPVAFTDRAGKERTADPDQATGRFAGVPENVGRLLAQMLSENRDERPRDALALEKEILSCLLQLDPAEVMRPIGAVVPDKLATTVELAVWRRPAVRLLMRAAAALLAATSLALLILPKQTQSGRQIESRADEKEKQYPNGIAEGSIAPVAAKASGVPAEPVRRVVGLRAAGSAAAEKTSSRPVAMNFSVVVPSYQGAGQQIQSVELSPSTAIRRSTTTVAAEPMPPGEGPDGPTVEVVTTAGRGPRATAPELAPSSVVAPGDESPAVNRMPIGDRD